MGSFAESVFGDIMETWIRTGSLCRVTCGVRRYCGVLPDFFHWQDAASQDGARLWVSRPRETGKLQTKKGGGPLMIVRGSIRRWVR